LLEPFDEIESSKTKIRLASKGRTLLRGGEPVGDGLGDDGGGEGGTGKARTAPAPVARMNKKIAPAEIGRRMTLASFPFAGFRGGALAFFDELLDSLATFLSDSFVEVRAVAIARCFAALLSTFLSYLLVELMAVR
jgi:hypothetical protein